MIKNFVMVLIFILMIILPGRTDEKNPPIKLGLDVLMEERLDLLKEKKVGVITNQTGVDSKGNFIIDLLKNLPQIKLVAIFGPEHGIRGQIEGGLTITTDKDEKTNVPIYSLYGDTQKPTVDMLQGIDVLLFDIQDVGSRFYTYISTMSLCLEAAAENNVHFVVLDRPNPITGTMVEGPVLDVKYRSFVGIQPIALRHGMTVGELALMFNEQGWLANSVKAHLTVIKMKNWHRENYYDELGLKWIKPSPNMPSAMAALLYPGLGLLETCNVSEGRGTDKPFINIGAPWLDNVALKKSLEKINLPGIEMDTTSFVPVDMPGAAMNPKYEGELTKGLIFNITNARIFRSVPFGINLICEIKKRHPDQFKWRSEQSVRKLFGNHQTPQAISENKSAEMVCQTYQQELAAFKRLRQKYLLYE